MFAAILAASIALVITIAVILGVIVFVHNRKDGSINVKKPVNAIRSVGVHSTLSETAKRAATDAVARDAAHPSANAQPSGGLKSRFWVMGVLVAAVFGTLTAKLWSMQILEKSAYATESEENQFATVYTPAPRGRILDAGGVPIVGNRLSRTILADPDVADRPDVVGRLSAVLGIPRNVVRTRIQDASEGAQSQRVVASDARMRDVAFIAEHSDAFPGVTVQQRTVRDYPYGALAAHVVGYTGAVIDSDLENVQEGRDLQPNDVVGRAGVEYVYDNLLAGDHGERKVMADAKGNVVEVVSETQPSMGSDIRLTIEAPVQSVCDEALAKLIAPNGVIGTGTGTAGAAVIMDVRDGGILAMASYPSYAPALFTGSVDQELLDVYDTDESHHPLLNRATQGLYPAASTYKAFTGLAALEYGFADTSRTWTCTGEWDGWNTGSPQKCWLKTGHGTLDFRGGIVNSCDTVFYDIAYQFYENSDKVGETAMQDYLKRYRFGEETGIDLGGEAVGRVPTPEWKAEAFRDQPEEAGWLGGDLTNMVIGQGYVQVTPLQIAVAYGAIATGKLMRPHVLKDVVNTNGDVVVAFEPEVMGTPDVPMKNLSVVRDALRGVTVENPEIAQQFSDRGIDPATVACKTGTAEFGDGDDYAWFACYAPFDDPKYVMACIVEEGGGGSATGAPLGAELMAAALDYDEGKLKDIAKIPGSSGTSVPYTGSSSGRTD
ncbi:penicillin-binding protein 2 [Xiamenia xianingshaonis]|uniref:Penicillin-binding protein 2 n=1 Tax=Xiamenia xianingshaonis TaxID=2682776 RepID=A0A9E6MRQ7_9ACTN|nr:penicillin-binding protein 2 [Xiamenia xianingshaonis]NHM14333.1 penicillin-binding protein 2 [Xiamenia xianingshaonis]QTU84815.1 penicillin-binding protein 2 [Xiamenia xianingshaonis]